MKNIFLVLIATLLWGCSKDNNDNNLIPTEPEEPTTPTGNVEESTQKRIIYFATENGQSDQTILTVTEIMTTDGHVNKKETYTFNNTQLIRHFTQQKYYPEFITTYETKLDYSENTVIVTDDNGNILTYTLNDDGYATFCKYETASQIRFYDFIYTTDNFLTRIEESIGNTFFSSLDLSYENGDLTSVTTFMNGMENKIMYTAGITANSDKLPCIPLSETYPMSTHVEALYAGLLGKTSNHLVAKTQPYGNDDEWNEYHYSTNEAGNISSLKITTHYKGIVYP